MVEENELINSGSPIVTLSSGGKPEVTVGIPEILISKIKPGQSTKLQFSILPDKILNGRVSEVGFTVQNGSTYPVTIDLLEEHTSLRPGMPCDVIFNLGQKNDENRIVVPSGAVGEDDKGRFVYTIQKDNKDEGTLIKKHVDIGNLIGSGFEITKGLTVGELIVVAGLNTVLDGDKVRVDK